MITVKILSTVPLLQKAPSALPIHTLIYISKQSFTEQKDVNKGTELKMGEFPKTINLPQLANCNQISDEDYFS